MSDFVFHRISFCVNGAGHGEVLLDGKPINVTAIEIKAAAGQATTAVLTLKGVSVDTDVEAELMKHHLASEAGDAASGGVENVVKLWQTAYGTELKEMNGEPVLYRTDSLFVSNGVAGQRTARFVQVLGDGTHREVVARVADETEG